MAKSGASLIEITTPLSSEALQQDLGSVEIEQEVTERLPASTLEPKVSAQPNISTSDVLDVPRYVVSIEPTSTGMLGHPALWSTKLAVLGELPLATAVAAAFNAQGIDASPADSVTVKDYDGVVDLRALTIEDPKEALRFSRAFFDQLHQGELRVVVAVTGNGGDFGQTAISRTQALASGSAGVLRCAAQEWMTAYCKHIDICAELDAEVMAKLIVDELVTGATERDVGIDKDGIRRVIRLRERPLPPQRPALDSVDVIMVSGGARGVTAASIIALAEATGARFVLLGRSPLVEDPCPELTEIAEINRFLLQRSKDAGKMLLPPGLRKECRQILAGREIRGTLSAITTAGGQAQYWSADVTDSKALEQVVSRVQKDWGTITGIVHGAGVLADKLIVEKDPEDFDWVHSVKVDGAGALLSSVSLDQLKLVCFFSSIAARSGNRGQSDYAAANEVLNRLAYSLRHQHPSMVVKSIGWGPWAGGMVTPQLKRHFESLGIETIPIAEGAELFVRELADPDNVEVVVGTEGLGAAQHNKRYLLSVDEQRFAELTDHTIDERVVLPMVYVLRAFELALSDFAPQNSYNIEQLQVLRPVIFKDFGMPAQLSIQLERQLDDRISLVLAEDQILFYRAMAFARKVGELPAVPIPVGGHEYNEMDIYESSGFFGGALFHGPAFQILAGARVQLDRASAALLINDHSESSQRLAMDGALQLALLWSSFQHQQSGNTKARFLPMSIQRAERYRSSPSVAMRLEKVEVRGQSCRSDIYLLDAKERVTLVLSGVQTIAVP